MGMCSCMDIDGLSCHAATWELSSSCSLIRDGSTARCFGGLKLSTGEKGEYDSTSKVTAFVLVFVFRTYDTQQIGMKINQPTIEFTQQVSYEGLMVESSGKCMRAREKVMACSSRYLTSKSQSQHCVQCRCGILLTIWSLVDGKNFP